MKTCLFNSHLLCAVYKKTIISAFITCSSLNGFKVLSCHVLNMSLRQLCKETGRQPSKALLYFPQERTTGIAPTRLIVDKSVKYKERSTVTVNWEGKQIQAEVVALDGK